ncbi:glycosyltransferase involved in cell wall biosynthesis [Rhodopseudomonas thermotolerans]|uniref:Glycosyltransferase involved in cell wall biosynthesis n=2 Tax=Rhodopseudomonas TaxID=1073 RepID=A0A336JQY9_9BRAD|nr:MULTISPECIES: glycosyltransferase family 1 protein [Rhodopseudomonas]RED37979.1 glycosyltransferase involved in cell wall biosynthesis [Rhodopseudomonas pentothenatexigens]REG05172.1 glycosyltransferase involved in cell wall biosynthesis [Rhodopseudomonas thermotolerans]SSW90004.1 glycosyltransferase involved in cell wall bisynthesis [Rhodopseudomonas pentothenatexigens]
MNVPSPRPFLVAIDAQVSTKVTGGTETALFTLLEALRDTRPDDPVLVIGLTKSTHELDPFLGPSMRSIPWPVSYTWYVAQEAQAKRYSPRFQKLAAALPLGEETIAQFHRRFMERPMSPRVTALARKYRVFRHWTPIVWRVYAGLRYGAASLPPGNGDRILKDQGVDVIHFPYPHHFDTSVPFVFEPWGLPHLHEKELFSEGEAEWMDELFGDGCRKAKMVVTATRWVKQDLARHYGLDPDKIAVIPRKPPLFKEDTSLVELPPGTPERFGLFPSTTWPTKNHIRLLRAVALLRDERGLRVNLVCPGRTKTTNWPEIKAEWERLKLQDQVLFPGSIPLPQLIALFKKASYLVHPSTFEGLGLPLIEAFQYGLPVLSSTATCKPEVVGDAAILFDALDERSIADAIAKAEQSPELLRDLAARGTRRVEEAFPDPAKLADMFMTVYRHAAGRPLNDRQAALLKEMLA